MAAVEDASADIRRGLKALARRADTPPADVAKIEDMKKRCASIRYSLSVLVTAKRSSDFLLYKRSEQLYLPRLAEG